MSSSRKQSGEPNSQSDEEEKEVNKRNEHAKGQGCKSNIPPINTCTACGNIPQNQPYICMYNYRMPYKYWTLHPNNKMIRPNRCVLKSLQDWQGVCEGMAAAHRSFSKNTHGRHMAFTNTTSATPPCVDSVEEIEKNCQNRNHNQVTQPAQIPVIFHHMVDDVKNVSISALSELEEMTKSFDKRIREIRLKSTQHSLPPIGAALLEDTSYLAAKKLWCSVLLLPPTLPLLQPNDLESQYLLRQLLLAPTISASKHPKRKLDESAKPKIPKVNASPKIPKVDASPKPSVRWKKQNLPDPSVDEHDPGEKGHKRHRSNSPSFHSLPRHTFPYSSRASTSAVETEPRDDTERDNSYSYDPRYPRLDAQIGFLTGNRRVNRWAIKKGADRVSKRTSVKHARKSEAGNRDLEESQFEDLLAHRGDSIDNLLLPSRKTQ